MHAAALAAAIAAGLARNLGQQPSRIGAFGQRMAVGAMARVHRVVPPEQGADSGGHRLLADAQVQQPGDLHLGVHLRNLLLEGADEEHRAKQRARCLSIHGAAPW